MSVTAVDKPATKPALGTVASVLVVGICLTWTYLVMRSVMNVGGSCADGGPYVSAQPCPGGTWLMALGIPVLIIASMIGTVAASSVGAPNLLVPMWAGLFGSLGWNFLEYSVKGPGVDVGFLVCGVFFWAMAIPAILFMVAQLKVMAAKPRTDRSWLWTPAYGFLGAAGIALGWWSYVAISG